MYFSALLRHRVQSGISYYVIGAAFLLGILQRIAWAILHGPDRPSDEAFNIARALAQGKGFSNALDDGAATAHMTPSVTLIGGAIYRLIGIKSHASEMILFVFAMMVVLTIYVLCYQIFRMTVLSRAWSIASLCFLLLAPIYTSVEIIDFRLWEGGVALLLLCFLIRTVLTLRGRVAISKIWISSLVIAATLFVSPTVGVSAYATWVMYLWHNKSVNGFITPMLIALLSTIIVFTPWIVRNELVLHSVILTRDNMGLETSLSYYEGAERLDDDMNTYWDRLHTIHPHNSHAALVKMINMGGEVYYNKNLLKTVLTWTELHKIAALKISLHHLFEYFFPGLWQFPTPGMNNLGIFRWICVLPIGLLGLLGATLSLLGSTKIVNRESLYVVVPTLLIPLSYIIVHPIPRYMWLDYPFLTFWSATFLSRAKTYLDRHYPRSILYAR